MMFLTVRGLLMPFIGTLLGSSLVIFSRHRPSRRLLAVLDSLAAGIMCSASFFSLILPALQQAEADGIFSRIFCSVGFFSGIAMFVIVNNVLNRFLSGRDMTGNMLMLSVSLHNIPEGMAVGVVYAGLVSGNSHIGTAAAMALSFGIAMQNIPEGAIISLSRVRSKIGIPLARLYSATLAESSILSRKSSRSLSSILLSCSLISESSIFYSIIISSITRAATASITGTAL